MERVMMIPFESPSNLMSVLLKNNINGAQKHSPALVELDYKNIISKNIF
jgi:hypothetical protein